MHPLPGLLYAMVYRWTLAKEIGWRWALNYPLPIIADRSDPHDDALEELMEMRSDT